MGHKKERRRLHIASRCSFCGKNQDQVERLIAGPGGVYICDECVALCNQIIQEEKQVPSASAGRPQWQTTTIQQPVEPDTQ